MKNLKFLGQWFLVLMTDGQEVNDLCKEIYFFFFGFSFNPLFSYVQYIYLNESIITKI